MRGPALVLRLVVGGFLIVLVAGACGGSGDDAERTVPTTLEQTIVLQPDGSFLPGPGEPYVVRTELEAAGADRAANRRSLVVFQQLADFRLIDEESPLRSEWLESCPDATTARAFRPHETLSLQAAAGVLRAANEANRSPVTGRPVDFAIHTGNAADNAQFNEQRWFIDLMDGRPLTPDTGAVGYDGVQQGTVLDEYPTLIEDAQAVFVSEGLNYPWYAVTGNRDLLAQGTFVRTAASDRLAVGDQKLMSLGPLALQAVCGKAAALLEPGLSDVVLGDPETVVAEVQRDQDRRLVGKAGWLREFFSTTDTPGPPGHGFSLENRRENTAYYVLESGPVSFIVLDTVNEGGFSTGSIDKTQFEWLEQQLIDRSSSYFDAEGRPETSDAEDRLIVIVSHHAPSLMNNPFPGPDGEERIQGAQLTDLLHRFPNVILQVAGHSAKNSITARPDPENRSRSYWEVTTASPLDYPMQGRMLEIVDNGDGTLSIFTTMFDSAAPLKPGDAEDPTPGDGVNELLLASLARQIAGRDP
ncbi:MAG: TIGR03767 family metallophosphoesterase, partial [Dehalococcoidia bacterium]